MNENPLLLLVALALLVAASYLISRHFFKPPTVEKRIRTDLDASRRELYRLQMQIENDVALAAMHEKRIARLETMK